jgi:hypothetical protein
MSDPEGARKSSSLSVLYRIRKIGICRRSGMQPDRGLMLFSL